MKKLLIYALVIALPASKASAQPSEFEPGKVNPANRVFKVYNNPTKEQTDQFDIIGFKGTTFTAANTADGTTNSFNHNVKIIVGLTVAKAGANNFQLNFYSSSNNIQQAATYTDGTLNIYYPIEFYDAIRTKLEDAFAAKRKVTIKVVQKPDGFREGTLVL